MRAVIGFSKKESGQVIPLVVILLLTIIAMVALLIDGSSIMFDRRTAQAAADAGALAGARQICQGASGDVAEQTAVNYAMANEVTEATASAAGKLVTVNTGLTTDSFFAKVFGQDALTARAVAAAGCYNVPGGKSMLPVAWSCKAPVGESDSPDCAVKMLDWNTEMYPLVHGSVSDVVIHDYGTVPANKTPFNFKKDILLTYIYIIVDDTKVQGDIAHSCAPVGDMDCDLNDDGINDVFGGGDRSWLDLDGGGGGAADLKDWVEHGYEGGIAPHTWLAGQSGVADSVYKTVNQTANLANPNGSPATYPVFLVPIFDGICDQNPEGKPVCMTTLHDPVPDEETVIVTGGSSTMYFHINGVSAMYVTCVDEGGKNQCPGAKAFIDANPDYKNLKTIEGYFIDNYPFELGNPGTGGVDVGVHIVSLSQ